jgi:Spy/CpxP family protein refolding chaperone
MGEFMAFRMHKLLNSVNATDAQKAQIKATWDGLRPQLQALRGEHAKLRQQFEQALTAPTVDPNQIEQLRKQSLQLVDKGSTLISQGVVATAQVLTPEQRQKMATEIQQHHQHDGK